MYTLRKQKQQQQQTTQPSSSVGWLLIVGVVLAYSGIRTPSFLSEKCPVPLVSTSKDSAPIMQLPPYQPPLKQIHRPLNKPLAQACRSFRINHIFPHNCLSKLPAPTDSNAWRARFRLARKKSLSTSSSFPVDSPCPGYVAFAQSLHNLQVWQFVFYTVATSRPIHSVANSTTCIPSKRLLHPSILPPAKRRCCPPDCILMSSRAVPWFVGCTVGPEYRCHLAHFASATVFYIYHTSFSLFQCSEG